MLSHYKQYLVFCFFLLVSADGLCQSQTRKVLFLGNSYTYVNNLPQILEQIAASAGDVLIYDSNLIGGYTLQDHYGSNISRNKILADNWDYIVLQEQSQRPTFVNPALFFNAFLNLSSFISQNKPCSQISSFMTWGYLNGDIQNCPINPAVCTYDGMQNLVSDRYMEVSGYHESEVTPVGTVWRYIRANYPAINLYQSDGSHPSLEGSYLAACCFYTSIFRKDPTLILNNYGLDPGVADIIKNAVKLIVFNDLANWYIGNYVPNSFFNYIVGSGVNEIIINEIISAYRDTFIWDFGDGGTSTELLPSHSYLNDGAYTIKLTSSKCFLDQNIESVYERTVNFCSHNSSISPNNIILCPNEIATIWAQPADSYQWLDFSGSPIAGANSQSLTVPSGSYSVITIVNGCAERSPEMLVDGWVMNPDCDALHVVDVEKPPRILISPNPVEKNLFIESEGSIREIAVFDPTGKRIEINRVALDILDVSILEKGVYLIFVETNENEVVKLKFIKK